MMTNILRLRARRFRALNVLLKGNAPMAPTIISSVPEYLSRDLGLTETAASQRKVHHLGVLNHSIKP